jgi:hypothetical protein
LESVYHKSLIIALRCKGLHPFHPVHPCECTGCLVA